ncbi:MAG: hypothetical protein HY817_02035 [Candidatus Abawacabacteria bacterium]|nr:hypothetical protein [Candidatus Abawacabacteria bacterium]
MSLAPAPRSVSVCSLQDVPYSMSLSIPTFSQGNVVGNHTDSYISFLEESFLVERNEYDLSGKLLWQVKRELAVFNEHKVLPRSSTIIYFDGTMVTSLREYNELLLPIEERLYIDGVQQMCKHYRYEGEKLVVVDQTNYTVQGLFSRRQYDQLISRDGATYSKRQVLDAQGKIVSESAEIAAEELVAAGVCIEV